jgi:hypothetical protein
MKPLGIPVPFKCVTTLTLAPPGAEGGPRIRMHVDDWLGIPTQGDENSFFGKLGYARRLVTGKIQQAFVRATGGEKYQ